MDKSKLISFIKDNFGDPEFKHTEKPLEDCSKSFLEGYISTRLQGKGVDIRMDEMGDVDLSYLEGLLEGSGGKVDRLRRSNDSRGTSRDDIQDLREQRLHIGEDKDDKDVEELREERTRLYDGIDEKVEEMVEDKKAEGKDKVEALREARIELFQEGGN